MAKSLDKDLPPVDSEQVAIRAMRSRSARVRQLGVVLNAIIQYGRLPTEAIMPSQKRLMSEINHCMAREAMLFFDEIGVSLEEE